MIDISRVVSKINERLTKTLGYLGSQHTRSKLKLDTYDYFTDEYDNETPEVIEEVEHACIQDTNANVLNILLQRAKELASIHENEVDFSKEDPDLLGIIRQTLHDPKAVIVVSPTVLTMFQSLPDWKRGDAFREDEIIKTVGMLDGHVIMCDQYGGDNCPILILSPGWITHNADSVEYENSNLYYRVGSHHINGRFIVKIPVATMWIGFI